MTKSFACRTSSVNWATARDCIGREAGYTLDRLPICLKAKAGRQTTVRTHIRTYRQLKVTNKQPGTWREPIQTQRLCKRYTERLRPDSVIKSRTFILIVLLTLYNPEYSVSSEKRGLRSEVLDCLAKLTSADETVNLEKWHPTNLENLHLVWKKSLIF